AMKPSRLVAMKTANWTAMEPPRSVEYTLDRWLAEGGHGRSSAMKVILFGATGMVGQGVLRECLRDDGVEAVLAIGRSPTGQTHSKLRELIRNDLFEFTVSQ